MYFLSILRKKYFKICDKYIELIILNLTNMQFIAGYFHQKYIFIAVEIKNYKDISVFRKIYYFFLKIWNYS